MQHSLDELVVFDSIKDQNVLSFVFNFEVNEERLKSQATYLIGDLLTHEGKGGFY